MQDLLSSSSKSRLFLNDFSGKREAGISLTTYQSLSIIVDGRNREMCLF